MNLSQHKIYLAPFQGITGLIFRNIYNRYFDGIDKYFTPFFSAVHKSKTLGRKQHELGSPFTGSSKVVPQILSKNAEEIVRFAEACSLMGFEEINWNLGCPYPRVANKKRGSGMLPYPDMVADILNKVLPEISINLSIKCRLGYFSPDELISLVPVFNSYDLSEVIVHARIGKQLYTGDVDLDHFVRAAELFNHPVVYNGDIFNVEDLERLNEQLTSIKLWMIGRGLLRDPFLPSDIKNQRNPQEKRATIVKRYVEDLYFSYRKTSNDNLSTIGKMKEVWSHLSLSFDNPQRVFNSIKKAGSFDEYESSVVKVFDEFRWLGSAGDINGKGKY